MQLPSLWRFCSPPISIMIWGSVHGLNAAGVASERALISDRPGPNRRVFELSGKSRDHVEEARIFRAGGSGGPQQILAVSTEDVYESA